VEPNGTGFSGMIGATEAWRPLAGRRIVDFGWVVSAPLVGFELAALGAEVIKIESRSRADNLRLRGAARPGEGIDWGIADNSPTFHAINRGKRSFGVDLKSVEGLDLVKQLIAASDALVENYTVGTMERIGLGDEVLRSLNPSLVRVSLTPAGRTGRLAGLRAYAATTGALAGLEGSVGYDEEEPVGMLTFGIADYAAGAMATFAVLAGLRAAASVGFQSIDASQMVSNIVALGMGFAARHAGLPTRPGNRSPEYSPHGIFRASDGRFVALAVESDTERARLAGVLGVPASDLTADADANGRDTDAERLIREWCASRPADEVLSKFSAQELRAALVAEVAVPDDGTGSAGTRTGVRVTMPNGTAVRVPGAPWRAGPEPEGIRPRAPRLGEDTEYVCRELLGISVDRFDDLVRRAVVELPHEAAE